MFLDLKKRSTQIEIMDDFSMEGELLQKTLDQIAWINQWLGGNQLALNGLKKLLKNTPLAEEICIVDLGCGNGDMLRVVADLARKEGRKVKLIGIDANKFTIGYARKKSTEYPEISYLEELIPSTVFSNLNYDIVLSTLFFHHFTDKEIINCLAEITSKARIGVLINDLHRSQWAIFLFRLLTIFIPNPMVRKDGETSILRGFKKSELQAYAQQLQLTNSEIRWRWAFRYQWIIKTEIYG
ncbi:MAG: methyltransferase domain-containing protein [Chitinophagales bacterium]|nr:methyltransferase domain-containing protein [Chitinophagales bacterium]